MQFTHAQSVIDNFPDNYTGIIGHVVVKDKERLRAPTLTLLDRLSGNRAFIDSAVLRWQANYQKMGAKPKYKSSLEEVRDYFDRNNKVYAISPLVDFYNTYCLCNGIPMAAYDAERIAGDMSLRHAAKDEPFIPLGNPKQTEKTKSGEIIYADSDKVMCRYWNLQDCHQTRITDDSENIVFFFDLLKDAGKDIAAEWERIVKEFEAIFGSSIVSGLTGKDKKDRFSW